MGFTANLKKRANMCVDRLLFLGGSGEAGGENAGRSDRIKTEGFGLNQHAHSKGLRSLLWLALPPRLGGKDSREEGKGG